MVLNRKVSMLLYEYGCALCMLAAVLLTLATFTFAVTPQSNYNLRAYYSFQNALFINSTGNVSTQDYFCLRGNCISSWPAGGPGSGGNTSADVTQNITWLRQADTQINNSVNTLNSSLSNTFSSKQCTGNDKISNVTLNSSGISVICSTDETGAAGTTASDVTANITDLRINITGLWANVTALNKTLNNTFNVQAIFNKVNATQITVNLSNLNESKGLVFSRIVLDTESKKQNNSPSMTWEGGESKFGIWRQYYNNAEFGWGITYNMPYNYRGNNFSGKDSYNLNANESVYLRLNVAEGNSGRNSLELNWFGAAIGTQSPVGSGGHASDYNLYDGNLENGAPAEFSIRAPQSASNKAKIQLSGGVIPQNGGNATIDIEADDNKNLFYLQNNATGYKFITYSTTNNSIGIGTINPNNTLEVAGNTSTLNLTVVQGITLGGVYASTWPSGSNNGTSSDVTQNITTLNNSLLWNYTVLGVIVPRLQTAPIKVNYTGTENAFNIVNWNEGDSTGLAMSIQNFNRQDSSLGVVGREDSKGTIKVNHIGNGSDSGSSALSILLSNMTTKTAAHGIFIDTDAGTTGKLLTIRSNGTEYFYINGTGAVRIISDNTNNDLTYWQASDGSRIARMTESSGGSAYFAIDDSAGVEQSVFRTDNGDNFIGKGELGIGTLTPSYKLDVYGNVSINETLLVRANITTNNLTANQGITLGGVYASAWPSSATASDVTQNITNVNNSNYWNVSAENIYPRLGGNVGINSTNPTYKFEISATDKALNVSNMLFANSTNVGIGTSNPSTNLEIAINQNTATNFQVNNMLNGTNAVARGQFNSNTSGLVVFAASQINTGVTEFAGKSGMYTSVPTGYAANNLVLAARGSSAGIDFYSGGSLAANKRAVLNAAGYLGINTSTPSYYLEISATNKALNVSNLLFANSTNVGIGTSDTGNNTFRVIGDLQVNTTNGVGFGKVINGSCFGFLTPGGGGVVSCW